MIKGKLEKFQPLKTGGISVLITSTEEHLHELVDLLQKEVTIQPLQAELPTESKP